MHDKKGIFFLESGRGERGGRGGGRGRGGGPRDFDGGGGRPGGGGNACHQCGKEGHRKFECPEKEARNFDGGGRQGGGGNACHQCGKEGHKKFECPEKDARKPLTCFNCDGPHKKQDCPNPKVPYCSICKNKGHFYKNCPDKDSQPPQERMPRKRSRSRSGSKEKANFNSRRNNEGGGRNEPWSGRGKNVWGGAGGGGEKNDWNNNNNKESSWGSSTNNNWTNSTASGSAWDESKNGNQGNSSLKATSDNWGDSSAKFDKVEASWGEPSGVTRVETTAGAWGEPAGGSREESTSASWGVTTGSRVEAPSGSWNEPVVSMVDTTNSRGEAKSASAWGDGNGSRVEPLSASWGNPSTSQVETESRDFVATGSRESSGNPWGGDASDKFAHPKIVELDEKTLIHKERISYIVDNSWGGDSVPGKQNDFEKIVFAQPKNYNISPVIETNINQNWIEEPKHDISKVQDGWGNSENTTERNSGADGGW
jgi:hypothetical protein